MSDAKETARDATDKAREGLEEGRRKVDAAVDDVKRRGKRLADKARELGIEGQKRALRAARDLGGYAEKNTAVVAVAALAVGVLIGRYLMPTSE